MRLIDADALLKALNDYGLSYRADINGMIMQAPTIEPTDTDLISRADAIKAIRKCKFESDMPSYWYRGMEDAQDIIENIPSAELPKGDLISRKVLMDRLESFCKWCKDGRLQGAEFVWDCIVPNVPSADAERGYTEWLEKIIVNAKTIEWLCEDTPCKEWCDENCHYSSIQVECLRHLYKVSKGGDDE